MKFNGCIYDSMAYCDEHNGNFRQMERFALDFLSGAGVDGANFFPHGESLLHRGQLLLLKALHRDRISACDAFLPGRFTPQERLLQVILAQYAGFDGILLPMDSLGSFGNVQPLLDEEFAESFRCIASSGFRLICSLGGFSELPEPRGPRCETAQKKAVSPLQQEAALAQIRAFLSRYPQINVTFTSFAFLSDRPDLLSALLKDFPNVSIDFSSASAQFFHFSGDTAYWKQFFTDYQDRILFGTACRTGEAGYSEVIAHMRNFFETDEPFFTFPLLGEWGFDIHGIAPLQETALRKIYSENFFRISGPVRPVNPVGAREYLRIFSGVCSSESEETESCIARFTQLELHSQKLRMEGRL